MANAQRGEVDFVAGGEVYTLSLTMQAIGEIETRTQLPYRDVFGRLNGGHLVILREVVWAVLKKHHAIARVEDAGELIDVAGGPMAAVSALARLFQANQRRAETAPQQAETVGEEVRDGEVQWLDLFVSAARAGLDGDQFWSSTLKELEFAAAARRAIAISEHDRLVEVAWLNAVLQRANKIPKLGTLLSGSEKRTDRKQTWQEMKAAMRGIAASITQGKAN